MTVHKAQGSEFDRVALVPARPRPADQYPRDPLHRAHARTKRRVILGDRGHLRSRNQENHAIATRASSRSCLRDRGTHARTAPKGRLAADRIFRFRPDTPSLRHVGIAQKLRPAGEQAAGIRAFMSQRPPLCNWVPWVVSDNFSTLGNVNSTRMVGDSLRGLAVRFATTRTVGTASREKSRILGQFSALARRLQYSASVGGSADFRLAGGIIPLFWPPYHSFVRSTRGSLPALPQVHGRRAAMVAHS